MTIRPFSAQLSFSALFTLPGLYHISTGLPCTAVLLLSPKGPKTSFTLNIPFILSKSFSSLELQLGEGRSENVLVSFAAFSLSVFFLFPKFTGKQKNKLSHFFLSYLDFLYIYIFYIKVYD